MLENSPVLLFNLGMLGPIAIPTIWWHISGAHVFADCFRNDVSMVTSFEGLQLLDALDSAWRVAKPKISELFDQSPVPEATLKGFMDASDEARW